VARGRPNDRPALFGSAEGMLIKGYSIGKSPFGPTHPSLGPLFLAGAVRSSARVVNCQPIRRTDAARSPSRRAAACRWSVTRLDLAPSHPRGFLLSGCDARPMHFEQDPF
jgi:hypothetical protein